MTKEKKTTAPHPFEDERKLKKRTSLFPGTYCKKCHRATGRKVSTLRAP